MKMTDGLFHRIFRRGGRRSTRISRAITRSSISARPGSPLSRRRFDVIVAPNLYGDILSDIASQVAGSDGARRIGERRAERRFDVRGRARVRAGHRGAGRREPVRAACSAAVQMLVHLGQRQKIANPDQQCVVGHARGRANPHSRHLPCGRQPEPPGRAPRSLRPGRDRPNLGEDSGEARAPVQYQAGRECEVADCEKRTRLSCKEPPTASMSSWTGIESDREPGQCWGSRLRDCICSNGFGS